MDFNTSIVNSISVNLNTINNNIVNIETTIDSINKSIATNWEGLAATEYKTNLEKSIKDFKSYSNELKTSIIILKQTLSDYTDLETNINKMTEDM